MRLSPRICALTLAAWLPLAFAVPDAEGNLVSPDALPDLANDAAMAARLNYNMGFEKFEITVKLEGAKGTPADVKQGFREARDKFRKAVAADPQMKQAWNLIGYTSRRLGEYEESLKAYDAALKLDPDYPEAIEYLAELYLLTGRLDEAKTSFAKLQKSEPSYAGVLLKAMKDWVAAARKDPAANAAQRDAFASWVAAQPMPK